MAFELAMASMRTRIDALEQEIAANAGAIEDAALMVEARRREVEKLRQLRRELIESVDVLESVAKT